MKKSMNRIIITKQQLKNCTRPACVSALYEGEKLTEVYLDTDENHSKLHTIYIGRVQNIVKNINAAFIEFEKGCIGYYPLEELPGAVFTKKQGKKALVIGDELLVQVAKDVTQKKYAVLTTNLSFSGEYFVLTTGNKTIGVSGKLSVSEKKRLKALVEDNLTADCGVIVRTNAGNAQEGLLLEHLKKLENRVKELLEKAKFRTAYSVLSEIPQQYIQVVKNAYLYQMDEIVTDDACIYEQLQKYFEEVHPEWKNRVRFYEDNLLPLAKLYDLDNQIQAALKEHVWLKSGAYLLIETTEACTVIDVNTGKFDGHKNKADTFFKINVEAAKEIAAQMRLRNLSGIILVDFINMEAEANERLLQEFSNFVKPDRIQTHVIDMTKLGIVEVTRKKERCCLKEAVAKLMY